jgi:hypothetical protein
MLHAEPISFSLADHPNSISRVHIMMLLIVKFSLASSSQTPTTYVRSESEDGDDFILFCDAVWTRR